MHTRIFLSVSFLLPSYSLMVGCAQLQPPKSQPAPAPSHVSQVAEELFPPLGPAVPKLRFHTGSIKDNQPEISPILPDIPGPPSQWYIAQWGQHEFLAGNAMTRNDPSKNDPKLGNAVYAFTAPDHHSHVWIYQPDPAKEPIYELYEKDGELQAGGGSNIFLDVNAAPGGVSLDKAIEYQLDAKISKASVDYSTPTAKSSGAVLAGVFTGFVISFPDPLSGQTSTLFLQIPHSSSRGISGGDFRSCSASNGHRSIIYGSDLPGDRRLEFAPDEGNLSHLEYSIDRYVCDLISRPLVCNAPDGSHTTTILLDSAKDFGNWKMDGIYVGLETEAKDLRPQSQDKNPQGSVSVALQLSSLHVRRYPNRPFTPRDCTRPN